MTRWNRSTHLALFVIGALATAAAAQPAAPKKQPTQQELASARAHFKAAEAAKARGDYKTAATEYLAAYELFPDPEFFFNVGEVYRQAGDEPGALTYYQKYLDLEPGGRGAAAARTAIDELQRSIAARKAAAKPATEDEAKRKAAEDARRKADEEAARRADDEAKRKAAEDTRRKADQEVARRAADDEAKRKAADDARRKDDEDAARRAEDEAKRKQLAASPDVPPAAPPPAVRVWYRDPIALGLLGTGVASIGVGTGFFVSARSADHDAKSAKTYQGVLDARDRASQRGTVGSIATAAGIALVGGGVAWIALHRDSGEQRAVTAWLLPDSGGLVVHGQF